ncbi:hypothetical protein B1218_33360, partial [Pseudomonas ogarae]
MRAWGRTPDPAASTPPANLRLANVLARPVNEWAAFPGRLAAPATVAIRPRVSGQIGEVAFTEGALVK